MTPLHEATEAREKLDRQIASLDSWHEYAYHSPFFDEAVLADIEAARRDAKAKRAALDVEPLLIEAREMLAEDHTKGARSFGCGEVHHKYGAANELIRAGRFDSDPGLNQYLRALRRGMELSAQPAPAPLIEAMEAAAKALEGAIVWDGYDDDVPAVWLNQADTALTQLTAQIEAARKGE